MSALRKSRNYNRYKLVGEAILSPAQYHITGRIGSGENEEE